MSQSSENGDDNPTQIRIECTECYFAQTVDPEDGEAPAELVIEHGQETGHKLDVSYGER